MVIEPGWGRPADALPGSRVHWYGADNLSLCDWWRYSGPRVPSNEVTVDEVCIPCLLRVHEAREVIG